MKGAKASGKEKKGIKETFKLEHQEIQKISPEYEAKHNLIGLFSLLLKIDQRVNPQNYSHLRESAEVLPTLSAKVDEEAIKDEKYNEKNYPNQTLQ